MTINALKISILAIILIKLQFCLLWNNFSWARVSARSVSAHVRTDYALENLEQKNSAFFSTALKAQADLSQIMLSSTVQTTLCVVRRFCGYPGCDMHQPILWRRCFHGAYRLVRKSLCRLADDRSRRNQHRKHFRDQLLNAQPAESSANDL